MKMPMFFTLKADVLTAYNYETEKLRLCDFYKRLNTYYTNIFIAIKELVFIGFLKQINIDNKKYYVLTKEGIVYYSRLKGL